MSIFFSSRGRGSVPPVKNHEATRWFQTLLMFTPNSGEMIQSNYVKLIFFNWVVTNHRLGSWYQYQHVMLHEGEASSAWKNQGQPAAKYDSRKLTSLQHVSWYQIQQPKNPAKAVLCHHWTRYPHRRKHGCCYFMSWEFLMWYIGISILVLHNKVSFSLDFFM